MPLQHAVSTGQQNRALGLSTFAFTICFAVWTIFAIIGIEIKAELGLNDTQFGLLVGTPILTGSLVRLFLGVWTDQYGGRIVFPLTMLASAASTMLLSHADSYVLMLLAAWRVLAWTSYRATREWIEARSMLGVKRSGWSELTSSELDTPVGMPPAYELRFGKRRVRFIAAHHDRQKILALKALIAR